jgi:hypothetical protein
LRSCGVITGWVELCIDAKSGSMTRWILGCWPAYNEEEENAGVSVDVVQGEEVVVVVVIAVEVVVQEEVESATVSTVLLSTRSVPS